MRRTASTSSSCVGARSTLTRRPRRRARSVTERLDQFAEQVGGLVDVGDAFRPHACCHSPSSSASQSMPPLKFDCHERREVMMRGRGPTARRPGSNRSAPIAGP